MYERTGKGRNRGKGRDPGHRVSRRDGRAIYIFIAGLVEKVAIASFPTLSPADICVQDGKQMNTFKVSNADTSSHPNPWAGDVSLYMILNQVALSLPIPLSLSLFPS